MVQIDVNDVEVMNARARDGGRWARVFGIGVMALLLTACPRQSREPGEPIPSVTIQVLDRFEKPVAGLRVEMKREHWGSPKPYDHVGYATTDAEGKVVFADVRARDWADANTEGHEFAGSVTLEAGVTEYKLVMNRMGSASTSFKGPNLDYDRYQADAEVAHEVIDKMFDQFVAEKATEFGSLEYYVKKGTISKSEADVLLRLKPMMIDADEAINFHWASKRLILIDYETPLRWEKEERP